MIKLFVMDVDGTLTDGGLYYDNNGNELKKFNVKDGAGIKMLREAGIVTMILTGRSSECVQKRGEELKIDYIIQGINDKAKYLELFMKKMKLSFDEVAYIGDDINDLGCIELAGNTAAPKDAVQMVREKVDKVCSLNGGQGAVREFAEFLLIN